MILEGKNKVYKIDDSYFHCGTAITMNLIGGKWKTIILWYLRKGPRRFSELKRLIPDITEKTLSVQLRSLTSDGLIDRKVKGRKPPIMVHYELTDLGSSLIPVIQGITEWGINFGNNNGEIVEITK